MKRHCILWYIILHLRFKITYKSREKIQTNQRQYGMMKAKVLIKWKVRFIATQMKSTLKNVICTSIQIFIHSDMPL